MNKKPIIAYLSAHLVALAVVAGTVFSAVAQEKKVLLESMKLGDLVVKNVRVIDATPTHVMVIFDGGGSRLKRQELPPELKALYPYDAKEAAEHEKRQAVDKEKRAAEEKALQERFNRELKAAMQYQQREAKAKLEQLQKDLNQLDKEMGPTRAKAKGKPNSPARRELDALRDQKTALIHRVEEQKKLLDKINKQLDRL